MGSPLYLFDCKNRGSASRLLAQDGGFGWLDRLKEMLFQEFWRVLAVYTTPTCLRQRICRGEDRTGPHRVFKQKPCESRRWFQVTALYRACVRCHNFGQGSTVGPANERTPKPLVLRITTNGTNVYRVSTFILSCETNRITKTRNLSPKKILFLSYKHYEKKTVIHSFLHSFAFVTTQLPRRFPAVKQGTGSGVSNFQKDLNSKK